MRAFLANTFVTLQDVLSFVWSKQGSFDSTVMPPRKKQKTAAVASGGESASQISFVGPLQRDVALCIELLQLDVFKRQVESICH